MAQWRCDVRISWRTQLISLLTHGVLILLILISPWPEGYGPIWLVLLTLVVFECIRSQKRIASRQGELRLLAERRVEWRNQEWLMLKQPWMIGMGILLTLQQVNGKKRCRLWLASDCLSKAEWRHLRQLLRYSPSNENGNAS
ncbi:membrane protein [Chania multitudinisentens RB-25]|uniref:Membrane protein n=1 Tax=Chania multitudinisentens RB-25 TaxID=1441930 RepID=W0L688_9GAMM|nr:protein YgfX [Chania multitudinisentens]AHG19323.1 membrane protein [Chania multitudinisentens RB-25]